MADKLPVKAHLRNGALYQSRIESSPGEDWKRRLLFQYSMHKQLKAFLTERNRLLKRFVYIGMPVACIALVFAAYFGFLPPADWPTNLIPVVDFSFPPIGLKEILVFAAVVDGLTFIIRKRLFAL
jgi:hypothetical protein